MRSDAAGCTDDAVGAESGADRRAEHESGAAWIHHRRRGRRRFDVPLVDTRQRRVRLKVVVVFLLVILFDARDFAL